MIPVHYAGVLIQLGFTVIYLVVLNIRQICSPRFPSMVAEILKLIYNVDILPLYHAIIFRAYIFQGR